MDMDPAGAWAGSVRDRPAPGGSLLPGISVLNPGAYCDGRMRLRQILLRFSEHGTARLEQLGQEGCNGLLGSSSNW